MNETKEPATNPRNFYEAVGGEETFRRLTRLFYQGVAADPALRAVYPSKDLGPAEEHLRLFLIQYWGGPDDYMQERGHPRLRIRHAPFRITKQVRDAWISSMGTALASVRDELTDEQFVELNSYFDMAATQMRNV